MPCAIASQMRAKKPFNQTKCDADNICEGDRSFRVGSTESDFNYNVKTNNISVLPIGKKAHDLFKKSDYNLILDYWQSLNGFDYEKSSEICDYIVSSFLNSKYDKVSIIYNEFKNVAVQKSVVDNFLPVIPLEREISEVNNNYIFEPNKNKIVNNLIPQTLKTQFLKAVLESNASEQG